MRPCRAALNVEGEGYACDYDAPHPGLAHANQAAQAVWCSDGEARRHGKGEENPDG